MKILYIANIRLPTEKAHGIQIMQMAQAFAKMGNDLELVAPRRFNWIKKDPFEYYDIERKFKIKKLPCLDLIPLYKYIGHLGFWVESATFNFFAFPCIFFKKADIIYTRDKFFLPLALFKKNLIFEAHGFPRNYFLYSLFLKKTKRIIVITQQLKTFYQKRGIFPGKILVAPDGVDLEKFDIKATRQECRQKLSLALDKKIVLYTGHLYKWKGFQALAEASRLLPKDTKIYFVGGTEEDIKRFRDLKFRVQIIGHRPYAEIPCWLRAADILVLPNSSREDISKYWTSPLKLFEYMASRRPIVASDLPSVREILNEENAVLVRPDDHQALAEGIKRVLEDRDLAEKISAKAFDDVRNYTWQKRAENILNFIKNDL